MRAIRLTKAERKELEDLDQAISSGDFGNCVGRAWGTFMEKVRKADEPAGVDVGPIEAALVKAAMGKVVALEGGHARASKQAKSVGATPELATLVGAWMSRQPWLHGPQTLIDVLNKWHQWLPKARATEPPPGLEPGLEDTGPSSPAKRAPAQGRRPKAGFR